MQNQVGALSSEKSFLEWLRVLLLLLICRKEAPLRMEIYVSFTRGNCMPRFQTQRRRTEFVLCLLSLYCLQLKIILMLTWSILGYHILIPFTYIPVKFHLVCLGPCLHPPRNLWVSWLRSLRT